MPRKFKVTQKTKLPVLRESYDERSVYPWMNIRTEYIEGFEDSDGTWQWPSVRELAERFEMPEKPLQNRASKERWLEYRKAHQNKIALERQKEHERVLAGKAVKFDEQAVETAFFANQLIYDRLKELEKLKEIIERNRELAIEKVDAGEWVNPSQLKASAISGAELESLAKAYSMFNETGRKALGIKDGDVNLTQNNIEVTQTNIREELLRKDGDRIQEFMRIVGNKRFSVPMDQFGLTTGDEEDDEEIIEAEYEDIEEDGSGESD